MSLKEELNTRLADLDISGLAVDKDAEYCGDAATKISFRMTDPLGLNTGPLSFEAWYTDKIALTSNRMAELTRINAEKQARAFLFDMEVEK
jgi:hypothetical protein